MANVDFFAAHDDLIAIFRFLFTQTDVRVFDLASEFGQELREFESVEQLESIYAIGSDIHGNGFAPSLKLWSPSVMSSLDIERVQRSTRYEDSRDSRYILRGAGLISLYLGGVHHRVITKTHYGHFSPRGAAQWGMEEGTDWAALKKLSNRIQYHIRGRLAVAKVPGRPILPHALELARQGYQLKETANWPGEYPLPLA